MNSRVIVGDCLEVMLTLPEASADSIVTDPPYGLTNGPTRYIGEGTGGGFMGKRWDHGVPGVPFWEAALRVAKPGAYLLAFGGTRTYHRLCCAIEDAGWEIRDCIQYLHDSATPEGSFFDSLTDDQRQAYLNLHHGQQTMSWAYATGFPKSLDIGKAIDKAAGASREVVGKYVHPGKAENGKVWNVTKAKGSGGVIYGAEKPPQDRHDLTAPSTDAAKQWDGWGTAIKPSWEPVILARKPLGEKTVAANVLLHGTGGLNIDGCRVAGKVPQVTQGVSRAAAEGRAIYGAGHGVGRALQLSNPSKLGRWPANLILSVPEDEYTLDGGVTAEQERELSEWLRENPTPPTRST